MTLDRTAPPRPDAGARPVRRPVAVLAAVAAGLAVLVALPPFDLWWLAPAGPALLAAAAHRRRLRGGFAAGTITGLVLFVPLLTWTVPGGGWLPWVLLSVAQAIIFGLLGLVTAWVSPLVDRWRGLWPVVTGLLWVAQEALRDRAPFGGFPWGRLAFSQGDAPALHAAVVAGAPAVTFLVAAAGGTLVALAWRRRFSWAVPAYLMVAGLLVAGPAAIPVAQPGTGRAVVAIVQGNVPRLGLDFNAQRRAVLDNHVRATLELAAAVVNGTQPQPALVVWPENASDIDPIRNADAGYEISRAANAIGAPILVGGIMRSDTPREVRNAAWLWQPVTGPDLTQTYVKRHPVPFAEYVPLRPVARFVTDRVDRVADMVAGDRVGLVDTGTVAVGDVICFEVAYDDIVRDTVLAGAQILAVQTNNATFNEAEALQQMAMVRLRSVEHGREGLMVSTVGVSGFVGTGGAVYGATGFNTEATVVREMALGGPRTLATRLGHWPELAAVAVAAAAFGVAALAGVLPLRRRRRAVSTPATTNTTEER